MSPNIEYVKREQDENRTNTSEIENTVVIKTTITDTVKNG